MVRLGGANGQDEETKPPMESLAEAVKVNNEDLSIHFAEEAICKFQDQCSLDKEQKLTFPPPIRYFGALPGSTCTACCPGGLAPASQRAARRHFRDFHPINAIFSMYDRQHKERRCGAP